MWRSDYFVLYLGNMSDESCSQPSPAHLGYLSVCWLGGGGGLHLANLPTLCSKTFSLYVGNRRERPSEQILVDKAVVRSIVVPVGEYLFKTTYD